MINIFLMVVLFSGCLQAATITWIAPSTNNDMQDTANWDPSMVPGAADVAVFNSSLLGVSTNPTESSANFAVSSFNFPNLASPFLFTFNNQTLSFSGFGITGAQKNPSLSFINTNNTTTLGDIVSFASVGTTGSAHVTSSNTASATGVQSGQSIGIIGSHVHAADAFVIADGGTVAATNIGLDTAAGSGGNGIAIGTTGQLKFDDAFLGGHNVTIMVENSGTFDGANSASADVIGLVQGNQFIVDGAFQVGDNGSFTIANSGNNSNTGIGGNQIGVVNAAQMGIATTGVVGDDASITITNVGVNSSATSVTFDQTAYLNDYQLFVGQTLQAGDRFNLNVSNTGSDSSTGIGQGFVALINSNSGTTGDQVLLLQGGALGSNATVSVTNNGTYSGTNTSNGSQVAGMNGGQFTVGDSTDPYNFRAGDHFNLTVLNAGNDSATGTGADAVGAVSGNQATFYATCSLGDQAHITIDNEGDYTGSASTTYVNVGSAGSGQLKASSTFQAGDDFVLHITNAGNNEGSGIGSYFIGDMGNGQQADFEQGLIVGNNGSITITNAGLNAALTTNQNQVGSMRGYGVQLLVKEGFNAGDDLTVTIANSGVDNSTVAGGNLVGFINNNTADFSASQLHLAGGGTVGNNASIAISNTGAFAGNNTGSNNIATLAGPQFASMTPFQAGNQFNMHVSMVGTNNGSGQNNNSIALLGGSGSSQVDFEDDCTVGNGASFVISNNGVNNDASGTGNLIGYITNAQMHVAGDFFAGTDLNISISNSATNVGDVSNVVGYVAGNQLLFNQGCTLGDGSVITVANSGTVNGSQILFNQGFDIASGKVTIQVTNEGTVTNHGIEIQGSNAGGNADIILNNSSLYVAATSPSFTIASLTGDATSIAQSQPTLIINQNSATQTTFAGSIQDFSGMVPTLLVKTGSGTQIFSGINSYTGLTTVQQGVLILNGSLAGDLLIDTFGTLKGSGTISGTVTNNGTIAPGQSIGTLTVGNYINNSAGIYEAEVNARGQADLIHALGTATINGGTVEIIPLGSSFAAPHTYTILTADAGRTGTFSSVSSSVTALSRLTYTPTTVQLTYAPLDRMGLSCNALNAADCFVTLAGPDATTITDALFALDATGISAAFNQMGPAQFSAPTEVQMLDAILVRSTYTKHLQKLCFTQEQSCDEPVSFWIDGIARWQHQGKLYGYNDTTVGGAMGVDYHMRNGFIGAAFSSTYDKMHWKNFDGRARMNAYYGGLYGRWHCDGLFMNAALLGSYNTYSTTRDINFGTIGRSAYATHNGNQWLPHVGFGYQTCAAQFQLIPYVNLDYVVQREHGYTEAGAGSIDLHVHPSRAGLFQGEVGVSFWTTCSACSGEFIPMITLAYINQTPSGAREYDANFANSGCCFTGTGGDYKRNLFVPRLALTYQGWCDNLNVSLYYDGQIGSKYWSQDVIVDFAFRF